ncbi:MAG TPA: HNH endonuclease [Nitrospiraceae bacterium]
MADKHSSLTQERLKELLHYDPDTGIFTWIVQRNGKGNIWNTAGCLYPSGYWYITLCRRQYRAHRLAWFYMTGMWPINEIDHINRDRLDNRFSNLRLATRSENNQNIISPKNNNKYGLPGIKRHRINSWIATIRVNGKRHYIGCYGTPERAHSAYLEAKAKLHPFAPK